MRTKIVDRLETLENRRDAAQAKTYIVYRHPGEPPRLDTPEGEIEISESRFDELAQECKDTGGLLLEVVYTDQPIKDD